MSAGPLQFGAQDVRNADVALLGLWLFVARAHGGGRRNPASLGPPSAMPQSAVDAMAKAGPDDVVKAIVGDHYVPRQRSGLANLDR